MKNMTNIIIAIILAFGLIGTGYFIKSGLIAIKFTPLHKKSVI